MKFLRLNLILIFYSTLIFLQLTGCKNEHNESHEPLINMIKKNTTHSDTNYPSPTFTDLEKLIQVLDTTRKSYYINSQTEKLKKFPCSDCHDGEMLKKSPYTKKAHWNIILNHAASKSMNCNTCHSSEGDMENLVYLNKSPMSLNHSYNLCQQCHFQQTLDWKGGAHGKRNSSWTPPRVIKNCTECHNPHSPQIGKKWPSIKSMEYEKKEAGINGK